MFALKFPITFARYQANTYKTNATMFLNCKVVIDYKLLWEKFNQILSSSNHHSILNPFVHMCFGTNIGDEFGVGPIYYKNGNELFSFKNNKSIQFAKWIGSNQTTNANNNNQIHGIPLQSKVILEIFAPNGRELVLIDPNDAQQMRDSSCWAINYSDGNWLDLPPFLTGDPSLAKPLIAATEKAFLHQTVKTNASFAVHLKRFDYLPHDLLIFDQLKEVYDKNQTFETWHQHLTERIQEHHELVGIAYILQYYLLLASSDGVLYARPRSNPKSSYHIIDFKEAIFSLSSCCNVISLKFSNRVSVFHVSETSTDPFLKLNLIFEKKILENSLSCKETFLFGPFVLFQIREMEIDDDVKEGKGEEKKEDDMKEEVNDDEGHLPEHLQSKNIPAHIKLTRNWKKNRKIMLETFGFNKKRKIEMKVENANVKPEKKGSIWLLVNYETREEKQISFPNIDNEWRFSHIKSASMSHLIVTFFSKNRFSDRLVML